MSDNKSFIERQRDAVVQEARESSQRFNAICDLVIGNRRQHFIHELVEVERPDSDDPTDISKASYVVQVADRSRRDHPQTSWVVVHHGQTDCQHLPSLDLALLHLIAHRNGTADIHATAARYAIRLLRPTQN